MHQVKPNGPDGGNSRVRIAVDMDEVIADYFGEQVARYQQWSGMEVDISRTEGRRLRECVPEEHREFVSSLPRMPGFFANLPMIEGSRDALELLARHADVYIVSAATEYPTLARKVRLAGCELSLRALAADRAVRRQVDHQCRVHD